jgi:hypothetical protein
MSFMLAAGIAALGKALGGNVQDLIALDLVKGGFGAGHVLDYRSAMATKSPSISREFADYCCELLAQCRALRGAAHVWRLGHFHRRIDAGHHRRPRRG